MLGKNYSRKHFEIFFLFYTKVGFDILWKLSPKETICMKCQSIFSEENKKNIIDLPYAEFAKRVVKVSKLRNTLLIKQFSCWGLNRT